MSGVSPIDPLLEFSTTIREENMDRMEQKSTLMPLEDTSSQAIKSNAQTNAENATLYGFRYTGMGSFIDKVF